MARDELIETNGIAWVSSMILRIGKGLASDELLDHARGDPTNAAIDRTLQFAAFGGVWLPVLASTLCFCRSRQRLLAGGRVLSLSADLVLVKIQRSERRQSAWGRRAVEPLRSRAPVLSM